MKKGVLDKIFGIRGTRPRTLPAGSNITERPGGWGLAAADRRVRLDRAARQLDLGAGLPKIHANFTGNGSAFDLNAFMAGYGRLRQDGRGAGVRTATAGLLEMAGYRPEITVEPAGGGDLKAVKIAGYDLGAGGHLVGMLKDYRGAYQEQDITVTLPESGYHYDVRAGRYLGDGSTIHTTISSGEAKLLASLPYLVKSVKISAPEKARPGEPIELDISLVTVDGAVLGSHVFVLEVFDPTGQKLNYYGGNLVAEKGAAATVFTTALNDSTGRWRIRTREVISGLTAESCFTLTP